MGTSSIIEFQDEGKVLCCVYAQYDGYPEGRGVDLARFLVSKKLVNGLPLTREEHLANGMGCLAAQWITQEKKGPGGVYMAIPEQDMGEVVAD
jgi:hypothetical protein